MLISTKILALDGGDCWRWQYDYLILQGDEIAAYGESLCKLVIYARYHSIVREISEDNVAFGCQLAKGISDFDDVCTKFFEELLGL